MTASPHGQIEHRVQYVRQNLTSALAADLFNLLDEPPMHPGAARWSMRLARFWAPRRTRWAVRAGVCLAAFAGSSALTAHSWADLGAPPVVIGVWATIVLLEISAAAILHLGSPLMLRTSTARYLAAEATLAAATVAASADGPALHGAVDLYLKAVLSECAVMDRTLDAVPSDALVRRVATLMATAEAAETP